MKITRYTALFFSTVFQPIFMPFVGLICILLLNQKVKSEMLIDSKIYLTELTFLFTVVLPVLLFLFFYKMKWISDLNITVRKERILPTVLVLILFTVYYILVRDISDIPPELLSILLGSIVATFIATLVTVFWKISIHSLGIFSVSGAIIGLSLVTNEPVPVLAYIFLVVAVCVGWSRLVLKKHTPLQVVLGGALGFITPLLFAYLGT